VTIVTTEKGADASKVIITTSSGERILADKCICTVPISVIQRGELTFTPPLPAAYLTALSRLKMALCDKIILRFKERWWPTTPSGILRYYGVCGSVSVGDHKPEELRIPSIVTEDSLSPLATTSDVNPGWFEWCDITDGVGAPVVVGFATGERAVRQCIWGKTDEEVVQYAVRQLQEWAMCVCTMRGEMQRVRELENMVLRLPTNTGLGSTTANSNAS
jgi:hypothetical protein